MAQIRKTTGKVVVLALAATAVLPLVGAPSIVALGSTDQGSLNSAYGTDGTAEISIADQDQTESAIRLSDGSLVIGGSTNNDAFLLKVSPSGQPASTFGGGDGIVTTSLGLGENGDAWQAVGIQSSGKIVAAGRNGSKSITVARFNSDGSVDDAFGSHGQSLVDIGGTSADYGDEVYGLKITPDNSILITGGAVIPREGVYGGTRSLLGISKLTSEGQYDTTFSGDGRFTTDCNSDLMIGRKIAIDSQDRILVAGGLSAAGPNYGCLLRLTPSGNPDPTFGSSGMIASNSTYFEDVVLASDDKPIVGYSYYQGGCTSLRLARYATNGSLDTSFGSSGVVAISNSGGGCSDYSPRLALQDGGKIVVGSTSGNSMIVRRFNPNGSEDLAYLSGLYKNYYEPVRIGGASVGPGSWTLTNIFVGVDRILAVGKRFYPSPPYDYNVFLASVIAGGVRTDPVTAALQSAKNVILTGEEVNLDATSSVTSSGVRSFAWDLDNDGVFELETGSNGVTKTSWSSIGDKTVKVRVTSGSGLVSEAAAAVEVRQSPPDGEPGISIAGGNPYTISKDVKLNLVWPPLATQARISNDGGFVASKTKIVSLSSSVDWTLDDSIVGEYTKIVYVRFSGSGVDTTRTYTDDIIFDNKSPTVSSSSAEESGKFVVISLAAKDEESGLSAVEVNNVDKTVTAEYATTVLVKASDLGLGVSTSRVRSFGLGSLRIRISDKAGNKTSWISLGGSSSTSGGSKEAPASNGGASGSTSGTQSASSSPAVTSAPGLTLKINSSQTTKSILSAAKITRPPGGNVSVTTASRTCRAVGSRIFALKSGTCILQVRLTAASRKSTIRTVRIPIKQ